MKGLFLAVVVAVVASVGCTPRLVHVKNVLEVTAPLSLACDWGQTRDNAVDGWTRGYEANPIMGENPTPHQVDLYFVSAGLLLAAATYVIPDEYDWLLLGAVTAGQVYTVYQNAYVHKTSTMCGL